MAGHKPRDLPHLLVGGLDGVGCAINHEENRVRRPLKTIKLEHIFDGFGDDSFRLKLRDKTRHMLNIA